MNNKPLTNTSQQQRERIHKENKVRLTAEIESLVNIGKLISFSYLPIFHIINKLDFMILSTDAKKASEKPVSTHDKVLAGTKESFLHLTKSSHTANATLSYHRLNVFLLRFQHGS